MTRAHGTSWHHAPLNCKYGRCNPGTSWCKHSPARLLRAQPLPTTMAVKATKLKMRMKKVCRSCSARDFSTWICCASGMGWRLPEETYLILWQDLIHFLWGVEAEIFWKVWQQTLQDLETALAEARSKIAELQEKTVGIRLYKYVILRSTMNIITTRYYYIYSDCHYHYYRFSSSSWWTEHLGLRDWAHQCLQSILRAVIETDRNQFRLESVWRRTVAFSFVLGASCI